MSQRDRRISNPTGQPGDDFRRIPGIGPALERRLHDAGILTYQDLADRTPQQIAAALANVTGVSAERIASQDWIGQARQLAGPPPEASAPTQRYASFHVELLLDPDLGVRRTKVHDHQTDTDDVWPGWDEDRLLTLLRDRVPTAAVQKPIAAAADLQPPVPPASTLPSVLPPPVLRIEELIPVHDGESGYFRRPDEPTSVRLTLRAEPSDTPHAATVDFTADVAAHSKLGDDQRWPLGSTDGAIRGDEPLTVELTGPPLRPGLYRLVATVAVYPADHPPEAEPFYRRDASGHLIQVANAPT